MVVWKGGITGMTKGKSLFVTLLLAINLTLTTAVATYSAGF